MMFRNGDEVVPVEGVGWRRLCGGKFDNLPGLVRGQVGARGEEHKSNVAGKIRERQHAILYQR